jgi:iron complex outermembrane recepter protein
MYRKIKLSNYFILLAIALFSAGNLNAEKSVFTELVYSIDKMYSGKVIDQNGDPVIGANIVIKGTDQGTVTDLDGNFSIDADMGATLVVSYIGYVTQEVVINSDNFTIKLDADAMVLEEIAVVGSRFAKARTDIDRPVAVDVLNLKDLQQTNQIDIGQSLTYSAPSFNAVKFGINDSAPFVDPATLRGLGPDQVLVLVNNKRRHKVSFLSINDGVGKGQVGTDVNVVPAIALKRVEILRDGAAAQYGSDAIAGVINMEMNDANSGGTVSAYFGQGYSKPNLDVTGKIAPELITDGLTYNLNANMGFKLTSKGFANVTATYGHTDGYDRSGPYKSSNGYYVKDAVEDAKLIAANGIDLDRAVLGAAQNTTVGLFLNSGYKLNDKWNAYLFGGYTHKNVVTGVFTRPPSNARRSVLEIFPNGYNPIAPANLQDHSITAGIKGKLGSWDADFSIGSGGNKVDWYAENTVNPSLGATYNGAPAPTEFYVGQTKVGQTLVNADIAKTFNKDSYPNYSIGIGTEFRSETFAQKAGDKASYEAGPLKATKDIGSSGREGFSDQTAGSWNRTNVGVYVEAESEVNKSLLFGLAVRGENYSDFGANMSFKANSRLKLMENLSVRGSYSRGFRAPSMTQIHYSNFVNISFDNAGNSITNPVISSTSELAKLLGVEGLKAETSNDISFGLMSKLGKDFILTADVFQIDVDNRIMLSGNIDVSKIPQFVQAGFPQSANTFVNAIDTRTKGIEAVLAYNKAINDDNRLDLNVGYSYMATSLTANRKTSKGIEVVDAVAAKYITDGLPKDKLILSLNYTFKKLGFLFRTTRFGEVTDPLALHDIDLNGDGKFANYTDAAGVKFTEVNGKVQDAFSPKFITDLSLSYNLIKNLTVTVGVNNVADIYPALLIKPQTVNEVIFSRRTNQFGTQGRFLHTTINYKF